MKDITQQDTTISKPFKPSTNQEKWVDTAIRIGDLSPSKVSEECSIDRTRWYDWIKDEQFIVWFRAEWDKWIRAYGPALDLMGIKKAANDFRYWESMQRRVGNIVDSPKSLQQINVGSESGNTITFVNFKNEPES